MKTYLRIAAITATVLACWSATAQYTFNAEIRISGKCFGTGSSMAENNLRQWVNSMNAMLKSIQLTREECIAMNRQMAGEASTMSFAEYGCVIKIRVTPCVCTGGVTEVTPGPDQGGSFNSTNPGNEVRDWASDVDARRAALDRKALLSPATGTGDKKFDDALQRGMDAFNQGNKVDMPKDFELMANMDNVRRYLDMTANIAEWYIKYPDPDHLVEWFHNEFSRVSGFDIGEIMGRLPSQRSVAEKQALFDYQMYRHMLADNMMEYVIAVQEETRAYEMAVLSGDCYVDSEHQYIGTTNYQSVNIAEITDPKIREWAEFIERCNNYDPGFNAVLYKNKVTGEYTLAFEGSNLHPIENWENFKADWKDCNFKQGLGGIPMQYLLAKVIADKMPKDVQINFTGHSLGGGLASVAGAITGAPTYTYNPEGVNNKIIDAFGMRGTVDAGVNNIKAYQADDDPLTSVQEGLYKVIGTPIAIGVASIYEGATTAAGKIDDVKLATGSMETVKAVGELVSEVATSAAGTAITMVDKTVGGNLASPAIGDRQTIETGGGHSINPMIQYFDIEQGKMNEHANSLLNSINKAGYGSEQQTEEHILIVWPDE